MQSRSFVFWVDLGQFDFASNELVDLSLCQPRDLMIRELIDVQLFSISTVGAQSLQHATVCALTVSGVKMRSSELWIEIIPRVHRLVYLFRLHIQSFDSFHKFTDSAETFLFGLSGFNLVNS